MVVQHNGAAGVVGHSDAYVALLGDDGKVYRWSLISVDGLVLDYLELSPNQSESYLPGLDLRFGSQWIRVSIGVQADLGGDLIPTLMIGEGEPWEDDQGEDGPPPVKPPRPAKTRQPFIVLDQLYCSSLPGLDQVNCRKLPVLDQVICGKS